MTNDEHEPAEEPAHETGDDATNERAEWVSVGSYASGLEADIARGVLEAEGIPVFVQGNSPGIFGLAFQGAISGGIELRVPSPELERALTLLDDLDPIEDDGMNASPREP
ncbi:MAG TPA: DUF2007 domain-containing protein [Gemmatimonas sp.]|nr:DUF2007 domain-containing protein [Gemmatimonas sp.]